MATRDRSDGLRADARRNRERILAAAREVFVERGPDAPLDEIATRAGVGNATLYRRFPDRAALMRALALDLLAEMADEVRTALADEDDPFRALARYMHRALDVRVGAVMPVLADRIAADPDVLRARDETAAVVQRLIETAQQSGAMRSDVTFGDIGLVLVRLSRPLPAAVSRALDAALAHRHLDLLLAGLRAAPGAGSGGLPGPALTLADLRDLPGRDPEGVAGPARATKEGEHR